MSDTPERIWTAKSGLALVHGLVLVHGLPRWPTDIEWVRADLHDALTARVAELEEALAFYADRAAWTQPPVKTREGIISIEYENTASKMQRDRGTIARAALAETPETKDD